MSICRSGMGRPALPSSREGVVTSNAPSNVGSPSTPPAFLLPKSDPSPLEMSWTMPPPCLERSATRHVGRCERTKAITLRFSPVALLMGSSSNASTNITWAPCTSARSSRPTLSILGR